MNNYTYITTGTSTTINGTTVARVSLKGICINKTLTGTLTVKAGATTIGAFAIGTLPDTYWNIPFGTEIENLVITTSAADDVTIFCSNI